MFDNGLHAVDDKFNDAVQKGLHAIDDSAKKGRDFIDNSAQYLRHITVDATAFAADFVRRGTKMCDPGQLFVNTNIDESTFVGTTIVV